MSPGMRGRDVDVPLVAFRSWQGTPRGLRSTGNGNLVWKLEERATCVLGGDHRAPAGHCHCGLYALHDLSEACHRAGGAQVVGAVEVWGDVEVYAEGVRAEHARIIALLDDADAGAHMASFTRRATISALGDVVYDEREPPARAAGRHYGLPVLPRDEFLQMAYDGRKPSAEVEWRERAERFDSSLLLLAASLLSLACVVAGLLGEHSVVLPIVWGAAFGVMAFATARLCGLLR